MSHPMGLAAPSSSVLWVNASQATFTDISLDTFRPCLSRPSFPSGAGKQKVCDRFDTRFKNFIGVTMTETCLTNTVDSRYLPPVGSQNSRARVKWFSRYFALSREGHDSRIQDHRPTLPLKQYVER